MKYFKLPNDFDTQDECDAYMASGEWKKDRQDFATESEWNEYLAELPAVAAAYRAHSEYQLRQAELLARMQRLRSRGVPAKQAIDWINRTAKFR